MKNSYFHHFSLGFSLKLNYGKNAGLRQKILLKNLKFIRDSVNQIKKYGYCIKNRSYLRFCPGKLGFLDVTTKNAFF
jgi:hypothetical protein